MYGRANSSRGVRRCGARVAAAVLAVWIPQSANAQVSTAPGRAVDSSVGAPAVPSPLLTTASAVRSLTAAQAAEGRPVQLRAQVTYYDPARTLCFVKDDTAGINVVLSTFPSLQIGDVVELTGVSDPGHFAPVVKGRVTRVIGHQPLPAAPLVNSERMLTGHEDSQWISIEGIVRAVYPLVYYPGAGGRLFIEVASGGARMPVQFPTAWTGPLPQHLVDARVRVTAVAGSQFSTSRQLVGVHLLVPSPAHIVVEQPALAPDSLAVQPIGRLFRYTTVGGFEHRIRAVGVVTAVMRQQFYLADATGGVAAVPSGHRPELRVGQRVELVGFPETGSDVPILRDVTVLKTSEGRPLNPTRTTSGEILEGGMDSQFVSVEGTLVQAVQTAERQTFLLESDGVLFSAELTGPAMGRVRPANGSQLRVTGICNVVTDERDSPRLPRSFKLLLRSPHDVEILAAPSWWNLQRTLWVVSGLTATILAALAWVCFLRRRVREQTAVNRERLEKEIALQAQFRELFDNANDVICTYTAQGLFIAINRSAELVLGYSRDEAMQMHITDLVAPEHRARLEHMLLETVETGESTTFEAEFVTREGQRVTLELDTHRVSLPGGQCAVQAIGRNVTERKLTELALRRAKDAAEMASRAKTEFVTNMSHEVRTPLNGILGMAGLLQNTELTPEQSHYLSMVKTSAEALMHVMNDVLDFSKIEAGRLVLQTRSFDLRECVWDVLQTLAINAREAGLSLVGMVAPEVPRHIVTDPDRLRQVLMSLVGNGLKFTKVGEVRLEVEGWHCSGEGTDAEWLITFRVIDTGIGVPVDKHRMIFEAFTQVDASMTRRYGGTGLGLAISSAVVQLMGGTIGLESDEGAGSTFSFTIPVTADATVPEEPNLPAATVLVIDQYEGERQAACDRLKAWGLAPVGTPSLAEATEFLRTAAGRECRFVLADFPSLPPSAAALIDAIRSYAPMARLVGCALAPQQEEIAEARRCGVVAFLPKPLRDGELLGACQAALRDRPQAGLQPVHSNGKASQAAIVLLVEDNVINQRVAEQILKRRGHEVRIAHNGRQAVDVLEKWTPDLVFMDVQMPEMNGIDATKAIRAREQARGGHVPIIALTAHAMAADRELCLRAGMDDYLTKPVSPVALTQTVERIVEHRSSNPQPSGSPSSASSEPILDPNAALERVDGDRELLGEIIALFQQDIDSLLQELEQAVQAKDSEAIMRTAHRLKGSVATFAAKPATEAALRLETMGRNSDTADAASAFRTLQAELNRLLPALESLKVEAQG